MKTSNVVFSVIAGAAVGALIGVLLAPDKGSNTRRKISEKSKDYAQGLKDDVTHMVDAVTGPFQTARNEPNRTPENARTKLSEVKK